MNYRNIIGTPTQRERGDSRQVQNNAGGFVYEIDKAARLRRFLVLGTEGGTFYASERNLTLDAVAFLKEYAASDAREYLNTLLEVDTGNVAPRHSTILLALAVLHTHAPREGVAANVEAINKNVKSAFLQIVRTASHLFEFVQYATMFRNWGRGLRTLVASWYVTKDPEALAYQVVKYRERNGWTHRDLVRKAHPRMVGLGNAVLNYVARGPIDIEHALKSGKPSLINVDVFDVIQEFEEVKNGHMKPEDATTLSWEMLPTEALRDRYVWRSLIEKGNLPYTAMLRNLGRMTDLGVFVDLFALGKVVERLGDAEYIRKSRVHPFAILTALKTYASGHGFRGSLTWTPNQKIVDTLDAAFYAAFDNVPKTGKRTLVALDVSASMGVPLMNSNVTAREGSVAMAMATYAGDPDTTDVVGFTQDGWSVGGRSRMGGWVSGISPIGVSTRRRLDDIVREVNGMRMGGTDCALPMLYAGEHNKVYDTFVIYTDNETWAGKVQPMDALRAYRKTVNQDARLVVVGMTSTGFTIADPQDAGTLDVVGFDASAPSLISNFSAGKF